ncbi:MAG: hypothetical protein FH756_08530 [Firmicutes bacterium]|nr:hypothetical protein [Bacillota bacterium]
MQYQADFTSMDTVRQNVNGKACGVKTITIPKIKSHKKEQISLVDAGRIGHWIRWAIDGGISLCRTDSELEAELTGNPRPADFMILLRYKAHMDLYARALEEQGIPFRIAGGDGFSNSVEMAEVLKILRAIIDPDDPVLLVAALRGSLFGISDNQLWHFKQAGGRFNIYSDIPSGLNDDDKDVFEWAFNMFRQFREWTITLPASAAMQNIMRELGIISHALTGELGKSRSGHLLQSQEFLAAAERSGITSFYSLVEYLTLLMESGVEEEINIAPWEDDAVRLMNLHKAKGLEAPVVFLANPGKNVKWPPTMHINRVGDSTPRGYFVIQKQKSFNKETLGQPVTWDRYCQIEQQYLDAEETRLIYVAATRAKNLLVVSTYPGKPDLSAWHPFNGHFAGVSELEDVSGTDSGPTGEEGIEISLEDLDEAKGGFLGPRNPMNEPSYNVAAVTELVKGKSGGPARQRTGRGQSWGRVMHRVLEACAEKVPSNLELFVENILAEEERDAGEKTEVLNLVNGILKSSLWKRMLKSEKRFVEVPLSVKVETGEYGFTTETIVSGAIDLVFLEDGGWVLVDYKTDTVEDNDMLAELVEYYTPQVQMYKNFWEEMVGKKVKETGFYFTNLNKLVLV